MNSTAEERSFRPSKELPVTASEWVVEGTSENFQQVVVEGSRARPVVIDFWAPWCGPCRALAPLLEKLAADHRGAFVLAKVNVDENPNTAAQFNVRAIPMMAFFKNGELAGTVTGVQSKDAIVKIILIVD